MSRQIDSRGAARWLKRAEQLAWALDDTGVRRNVIDGYLVEGRRVGSLRTARVLDLPGRFVPFENLNTASNIPGSTERPWPLEVTAPGRGVMLERAPGDDVEFAFERPAAPALQTGLIGEAPTDQLRSLGITVPSAAPHGVVQVRLVCPASDPVPAINASALTIDYRGVSGLWVLVSRWGAGGAQKLDLMINEQVITELFGCPVLQRAVVPWANTTEAERRAWAAITGSTVIVALQLSENSLPLGVTASLGIMVIRPVDGEWQVVHSVKLAHSDLNHPLFALHTRISHLTGAPIWPEQLSGFDMTVTGMATDGVVVRLTSVVRHEIDATAVLPFSIGRGSMVVTGLLRCELNLHTMAFTHSVDAVTTDVGETAGTTNLAANLTTTNGVPVSAYVESWLAPDWPIHCTVTYDGLALHELVGFALGYRGATLSASGPSAAYGWRGMHTYRDPVTRFALRSLVRDETGSASEAERSITTNAFGFNAMTQSGSQITLYDYPPSYTGPLIVGIEDGQGNPLQAASIGLGGFELPLYRGAETGRVLARLELDGVGTTEAALAAGATTPVSTCYAMRRQIEDQLLPHRSVVTYRLSGNTIIETREANEVVAYAGAVSERYPVGVFYVGNALAVAPYGRMGWV